MWSGSEEFQCGGNSWEYTGRGEEGAGGEGEELEWQKIKCLCVFSKESASSWSCEDIF